MRSVILALLLLFTQTLEATFPVSHQGRFRPSDVYAKLWLYDFYHAEKIKDPTLFGTKDAETFLWQMEYNGHTVFDEAPLFWIQHADIKRSLKLPLTQERFSYKQLQGVKDPTILPLLQLYTSYLPEPFQQPYEEHAKHLIATHVTPKEIAFILEQQFPYKQRLNNSGHLLKALPAKNKVSEWYPLHALALKIYDPLSNRLKYINNFTAYTDAQFTKIQQAYLNQDLILAHLLEEAYSSLAGKPYLQAHKKSLNFPTLLQLKIESFYYNAPLLEITIMLYALAIGSFILSYTLHSRRISILAFCTLVTAFILHSCILCIRCFILQRPPVSNMFETVIYVPWIALIASFGFWFYFKRTLFLLASSIAALGLLILLKLTNLNSRMENVQAVLDSQYWLIVHVLLVVGSYGLFILAGILGQFYLGLYCLGKQRLFDMRFLAQSILQTMYLGVALLIPGTILGGVWAAESWGRFWDWDPKESWAFISSCVYLVWIHAYIFNKIGSFGLAVGSVIGLMTISFTWYGVNYILGTGLHSYGFGSGGEGYYALYLILQMFFIAWSSFFYRKELKFLETENKSVL